MLINRIDDWSALAGSTRSASFRRAQVVAGQVSCATVAEVGSAAVVGADVDARPTTSVKPARRWLTSRIFEKLSKMPPRPDRASDIRER